MSNLLTTQELEVFIDTKYKVLKEFAEKEDIYCKFGIYFAEKTPNNEEGIYVYANSKGYHYNVTERGQITLHKTTSELFEISYWIFSNIIFKMSLQFATKHKKNDQDFRRILFNKKLELLNLLGKEYSNRGEIEINEILKTAPYDDKLMIAEP